MKFCSQCGKPLTDDMNFCSGCGHKIEKEIKTEINEEATVENERKEVVIESENQSSDEANKEEKKLSEDLCENSEETKTEDKEKESKELPKNVEETKIENNNATKENKGVPEIPKNLNNLNDKKSEINNTKHMVETSKFKNRVYGISELLMKHKKKTVCITIAVLLVVIFGAISLINKRPSFTNVYIEYLDSKYAEVADDDSWLRIDTNPYDIDDYYSEDGVNQLETAIEKLKLPSTLAEEMYETRAMDGRQEKSYNGINVSWTYHPSQGIEVLFTKE